MPALFAFLPFGILFGQTGTSLSKDPQPSLNTASRSDLNFDTRAIDKSANPCENFYQYAYGTWLKNNPIPADQSRWGRFSELEDRNREVLHEILEEAAQPNPARDAITKQVGDYYAACMQVPTIDAKGLAPLQPELDRIHNLKDKPQLGPEIANLHRSGTPALFEFGSGQDFKNSNEVIAQLDQGGLGLPDRDYYLKNDQRSVDIRQKYLAHIRRMFELAGEPAGQAKADAQMVVRIETELAKGSLDRVSRRDPEKVYHRVNTGDLGRLYPSFPWNQYFVDSGAPEFHVINVAWPDFFQAVNATIDSASLDDWKVYLQWHLLHSKAVLLSSPFVEENFNFYGAVLSGAKQMRPRWKRCVDFTDAQLGEALGEKFVDRTFRAAGKQRTLKMVDGIEKAFGAAIANLTWMTEATKQEAQMKLKAITNKIGYPETWRDYSSVQIKRDDAMGNGIRAGEFEFQRQLNKIGKPPDRREWSMPPHRECLLQPANEHHQFSCWHTSGAVLRQSGR
jgi:endothelin-converting enzyme/putative endopeptidase